MLKRKDAKVEAAKESWKLRLVGLDIAESGKQNQAQNGARSQRSLASDASEDYIRKFAFTPTSCLS